MPIYAHNVKEGELNTMRHKTTRPNTIPGADLVPIYNLDMGNAWVNPVLLMWLSAAEVSGTGLFTVSGDTLTIVNLWVNTKVSGAVFAYQDKALQQLRIIDALEMGYAMNQCALYWHTHIYTPFWSPDDLQTIYELAVKSYNYPVYNVVIGGDGKILARADMVVDGVLSTDYINVSYDYSVVPEVDYHTTMKAKERGDEIAQRLYQSVINSPT